MTAPAVERPVTVYEPGHGHPRPLAKDIRAIWARRTFIAALARAGERATHRATRLGPVWTVLNPVLLAGVYFVVFGLLLGGERGTATYLAQLVGSLFLFYFTRNSVTGGARSIVRNTNLVSSTTIPRAVLPLSAVVAAIRTLAPMLAVYAVVHVVTGLPLTTALLTLPLLLAVQTVFNTGLALGFAAANANSQDVQQALPYALRIWVYLSPILYRTDEVLARLPDRLDWLVHANPLTSILSAYQAVLLDGAFPAATDLVIATGWALASLALGTAYFRTHERGFALAA